MLSPLTYSLISYISPEEALLLSTNFHESMAVVPLLSFIFIFVVSGKINILHILPNILLFEKIPHKSTISIFSTAMFMQPQYSLLSPNGIFSVFFMPIKVLIVTAFSSPVNLFFILQLALISLKGNKYFNLIINFPFVSFSLPAIPGNFKSTLSLLRANLPYNKENTSNIISTNAIVRNNDFSHKIPNSKRKIKNNIHKIFFIFIRFLSFFNVVLNINCHTV